MIKNQPSNYNFSSIVYKAGYKYQLQKNFGLDLARELCKDGNLQFSHPYFSLWGGLLRVNKGYAWDGPSGPTFDTKNFMRGSLVHDVLYQAIRLGLLAPEYRETADKILHKLIREDGMSALRAWYVYQGVRKGAGFAAEAKYERPLYCAP